MLPYAYRTRLIPLKPLWIFRRPSYSLTMPEIVSDGEQDSPIICCTATKLRRHFGIASKRACRRPFPDFFARGDKGGIAVVETLDLPFTRPLHVDCDQTVHQRKGQRSYRRYCEGGEYAKLARPAAGNSTYNPAASVSGIEDCAQYAVAKETKVIPFIG